MRNAHATTLAFVLSSAALAALVRRIARGATGDLETRVVTAVGVREASANRISALAEPRFVALEALAFAWLMPRIGVRERVTIVAAPLVAGVVGHALKRLVPRERPNKTRFTPTGGESFPSTHTAYATALGFAIAGVLRGRGGGAWAPALAGILSAAIGIERIRGAAHWPSDVVAGGLLGLASGSAARLMGTYG